MHRLRWRKAPHDPRRLRFVLGLVLGLHVLFGAMTWYEMRPHAVPRSFVPVQLDNALRVRLIARPVVPAASPAAPSAVTPPARPPIPSSPLPKRPRESPAPGVMTASLATPPVATPPRLYDRNGQILLPAPAASSPTPAYVQRLPQGDARIMQHNDPVKYRPTRFEQYFPPPGETAGGALVRHVVEAVVKSKPVDLPRGVHLKCMTVFGIPVPDCAMPPAPPPPTDGDERLSMASTPLAKDPHAPKPPGVDACIAAYRADKPLPYGCPVDTPNRAVDAELRERVAHHDGR